MDSELHYKRLVARIGERLDVQRFGSFVFLVDESNHLGKLFLIQKLRIRPMVF